MALINIEDVKTGDTIRYNGWQYQVRLLPPSEYKKVWKANLELKSPVDTYRYIAVYFGEKVEVISDETVGRRPT